MSGESEGTLRRQLARGRRKIFAGDHSRTKYTMTRILLQEPGWKLERKGSALLLRRDSSHLKTARVCFRYDVEVREFEPDEDYMPDVEPAAAASPLAMCASCLAALFVTVILPWLLFGG